MTVLRRLLFASLLMMLLCFATAADTLPSPQASTPAAAPAQA